MTRRALVLGGGGYTGVAWEVGVLEGLRRGGVDPSGADLVVGTSAGAVVGSQLCAGTPVDELYEQQLSPPAGASSRSMRRRDGLRLLAGLLAPGAPERRRARTGRLALAALPGDDDDLRAELRPLVPADGWPAADLRLTAVDAVTGEFVVHDRTSGVDLLSAVAASCAVPTVWPAASVDGRRLVDGGMRSMTNADVAEGCDVVVVLAPLPRGFTRDTSIPAQLRRTGARRTVVVTPDREARRDIGKDVLDPRQRAVAARTGLRQAAEVLADVAACWGPARPGG